MSTFDSDRTGLSGESPSSRYRLVGWRALALSAAYVLLGWACMSVPSLGSDVALVWLPNGVALAAMVRWGRGYALATGLASFGVLVAIGRLAIPEASGIALGSAIGPMAGAALLAHWRFDRRLERQRDLGVLVAASAAAAAASSGIGLVSTLAFGDPLRGSVAWEAGFWWVGDLIGYLLTGALLLAADRPRAEWASGRGVEFTVALVVTVATSMVGLAGAVGPPLPAAFLVLVPLTWLALRFGIVGASAGATLIGFLAAWATASGNSQFVRPDAHESLALLWSFILTVSLVALTITVVQAERIRAERTLSESDQLLRDTFDKGTEAQLVSSPDGFVTAANPPALSLFGYDAATIVGLRWARLVDRADPGFESALATVRRTGVYAGPLRCIRADGTPFPAEVVVSMFVLPDGRRAAHARVRDTTAQEVSERELTESRDQLAAAERLAGLGHWRWWPATGRVACSDGHLRNFGFAPGEFAGTLDAWLARVHPDDRDRVRTSLDRAAQERSQQRFSFRAALPGGSFRHLLTTVDPAAGGEDVLFGTTLDVTEAVRTELALRESEARYRSLTDSVPVGVFRARATVDGPVLYDFTSTRFLSMLGIDGADAQSVRARMIEVVHPDDRADLLSTSDAARRMNQALEWEGRVRVRGETRWMRIEASKAVARGDERSWVGVVMDITDRHRDEERRRFEQSVLEALAQGHPLGDVLERLVIGFETLFEGMLGSVMRLDPDGRRLRNAAAPHLPEAWMRAIDGLEIGPDAGAFGAAAATRQAVVSTDIATDPAWTSLRVPALAHDLRACWSFPILSSSSAVLGTLSFYTREPRDVTPDVLAIAQRSAWLAALAMERDRVMRALTESEARFRMLYNRTPAMLMSIGVDGTVERVSDFWLAKMGYGRDEVIGRLLDAFLAPESRRQFRAVLLPEFLATGERYNTEAQYLRKDGGVIDVLVSSVAVRGGDGRVLHSLSIVVDISERKRAERFRDTEQDVLVGLARGEPIASVLTRLMASYERLFPGMRCAMLRVLDDGRRLGDGLAPSLPADYVAAVNGIEIRDGNCACGSSAASKTPVVCADLATDPRWEPARALALGAGLRACWSFPLVSSRGEVLGTFSQYYGEPREPSPEEIAMIERGASIATLAIERDRTVEALRTSEARFRALYNRTPAMQHVNDIEGRILQVSDYWLEVMGYSRDEVVERSFDEFLTPASRRYRNETVLPAALVAGRVKDVEYQVVRHDGSLMDVLLSSTAERGTGGELLRWYSVLRDITDRKRAEAALVESQRRLAGIVDSAMDAIITCDENQRILVFNAAAETVFGCDASAAIGTSLERFIPATSRGAHSDSLQRFGERGDARRQMGGARRVSAVRADGEEFPIEASVSAVRVEGRPLYTVILRDITERLRAESTRARLEAQLREAQKMEAIGTLAGGIAHDFNNIIGAIVGNVDLARHDLPPGHPASQSLEEIAKSSHRARDVIEQILTFSRREEPQRRSLDVRQAVEDAFKLLRATLPANVRLSSRVPARPAYALADSTQLHQLLINLGTNAWHALEGKPGDIEIVVDEVVLDAGAAHEAGARSGGPHVHIAVRDNGVGMDEETQARIFEPFFTTKPAGKGTGLGLAVVHGIVRGHGGGIVCRSVRGAGSTFHVYLPAAESPAIESAAAPSAPARGGAGQHLVYVDDDEALVFLAQRLFARAGYKISGYTDPAEALAAIRADPAEYRLVVSDYSMPTMTGIDFARAIRTIRSDLPVVITTGYVTDELRRAADDVGVREIVYKPDTAAQLVSAVERLLGELPRAA
ncbi:MAG: PAS domain S-box protein [Burkholderiales bacterium]